jgi:hypothetical protein
MSLAIIASAAKQSSVARKRLDCFAALAMTFTLAIEEIR